MKKDKEWLKEKLLRELMQFNSNPNMTDYEIGIKSGIRTAMNLTEKLDKQEVLSPNWIDKHSNGTSRSQYVWVDDLKELLVSKQEEPVIPQFAADYIEKWKYEGLIMHEWFTFDHDNQDED